MFSSGQTPFQIIQPLPEFKRKMMMMTTSMISTCLLVLRFFRLEFIAWHRLLGISSIEYSRFFNISENTALFQDRLVTKTYKSALFINRVVASYWIAPRLCFVQSRLILRAPPAARSIFFFLYGAAARIGPWPPLYEVP
jgi:hypothetical protein